MQCNTMQYNTIQYNTGTNGHRGHHQWQEDPGGCQPEGQRRSPGRPCEYQLLLQRRIVWDLSDKDERT